jgi:hypothetical protein
MIYKKVSSSFVRPADTTAYTANDLVANSSTAIDVNPLIFNTGRGGFRVVQVRIVKSDGTDVTNSSFKIHFFGSNPTPANGDNGAFSTNVATPFGVATLPQMTSCTDDAFAVLNIGDSGFTQGIPGFADSTYIYGLLQAVGAYTPVSEETFTVTLTIEKY